MDTFGQYKDRRGRDAINLTHSEVEVTDIYALQNGDLNQRYQEERVQLQAEARVEKNGRFVKIHQHGYKNQDAVITEEYRITNHSCDKNINEVFLFHGTKRENIDSIAKKGFLVNGQGQASLYGSGVYLAECSEKADQYAGNVSLGIFHNRNITIQIQICIFWD